MKTFKLFSTLLLLVAATLSFAQTTQTFTNSNATIIPGTGSGPAIGSPYPSTVSVSGMRALLLT
jgi:hypothetical protein